MERRSRSLFPRSITDCTVSDCLTSSACRLTRPGPRMAPRLNARRRVCAGGSCRSLEVDVHHSSAYLARPRRRPRCRATRCHATARSCESKSKPHPVCIALLCVVQARRLDARLPANQSAARQSQPAKGPPPPPSRTRCINVCTFQTQPFFLHFNTAAFLTSLTTSPRFNAICHMLADRQGHEEGRPRPLYGPCGPGPCRPPERPPERPSRASPRVPVGPRAVLVCIMHTACSQTSPRHPFFF